MGVRHDDRGSRPQRWQAILELLADRDRLTVAEASHALRISAATIRRDFAGMADQQLVTRIHGGVVATTLAYRVPTRSRDDDVTRERLAVAAAELVTPGLVVGLNGGRTTTEIARRISTRPDLAERVEVEYDVTVVTNAINIVAELVLRPHIRAVCLGGVARARRYQLTGQLTLGALDQVWVDLLFLSVDGIAADTGATSVDETEANIAARMAERAKHVVIVGSGAKVGRRTYATVCASDEIQHVITDESANPRHVAELRAMGVKVDLV